ncbi:biliverdin-producing heme oxygenase [Streptomyces sp. NPDC058548]|uniref:biliverdin-producing heme oxygenase n=1 Tax=unclassified Streptomyces TaxID=2593676 RepID=UPI0036503DE6
MTLRPLDHTVPAAGSPPGLLEHLRSATRAAHTAQERQLAFLSRLDSTSSYVAVLEVFLGFQEPLEEILTTAVSETGLPWRLQPGTERIKTDLLDLGLSPDAIAAVPRCPDVPRPATVTELIGMLYVTEGAALGGQLISRWVEDALSLTATDGVSYFAGTGDARRRLREFTTLAEATVGGAGGAAVAAANHHFGAFGAWTEQRLGTSGQERTA